MANASSWVEFIGKHTSFESFKLIYLATEGRCRDIEMCRCFSPYNELSSWYSHLVNFRLAFVIIVLDNYTKFFRFLIKTEHTDAVGKRMLGNYTIHSLQTERTILGISDLQ